MDKLRTTGIIEKVIYGDTGNVRYYVSVNLNGTNTIVKSNFYSSKTKSLPEGKNVVVDYMISTKGVQSVEIINEDIVPCKSDLAGELRILALFGIMVIVVICVFIIKNN